ncbi:MAG TPA: hypothetical protein VM346_03025 [Sphingomicrobium sp.]|nr:hypothetical protein [Sphingomicrobium sp.]
MKGSILAKALGGAALLATSVSPAFGQAWVPGSEIVGHSAQVQTGGVVNTVHFDPGGAARIVSPAGNVVNGTWSASGGMLCLNAGTAQECWPYARAFQAGQPMNLTSTCQVSSTWMALSTNQPMQQARPGERG